MSDTSAINWDDLDADPPPQKPRVERWMVLGVVTLAIFVRGRAAEEQMQQMNRDPHGYRQIAEALTRHGVYGLFLYTSKPIATAYRAPLYPLLLAPIVVLGEGTPLAVAFIHLLLGGTTVWLVWRLGCRWGLPHRAALLASALVAIDPILVQRSGAIESETLATLLVVTALYGLTSFSDRPSWPRAGLAGACLGVCALCQPPCLAWLVSVVALMPTVLGRSLSWPARLSQAVVSALGAAVVLAPWVVRNQLQFGAPIITTTRGGYTLLLGNNPSIYRYLHSGTWDVDWDTGKFDEMWLSEQRKVAVDEASRDRHAYAVAWQNICAQPGMFLLSCAARAGSLWGVVPYQATLFESHRARFFRYLKGVWYALEFLLAAMGVHAIGRKTLRAPWLWGVLLVLSLTAVHAVFWAGLYDRAPLMPVLALLAAAGMRSLWVERRPIKVFA